MNSFKMINENSLASITSLVKNRNTGMLSASRGTLSPEENDRRTENLKKDLMVRGLKHIPLLGRYIENFGKKNATPVDEKSFFVHGKDDILPHLMELGKKYDQDSILHKKNDESVAKLHGTNDSGYPGMGKTADVGEFKPHEKGEFHSVLPDGKTFSFS
jgi:hypothetical protein